MRHLMSTRPILGAAAVGFLGFVLDAGISLVAGEPVVESLVTGLVVGVAITGALALANLSARKRGLR
jgi:hypothetical protein